MPPDIHSLDFCTAICAVERDVREIEARAFIDGKIRAFPIIYTVVLYRVMLNQRHG